MKAAVVSRFDSPPRYADAPEPAPADEHQRVVDVLACGLHPRVRSQASGAHYTSDGALPLVPGIDGVGRDADGSLRYFILFDTPHGAMAERVAIDERRSVRLPADVDPVTIAAAMNPAMSSWVALRRRIEFAAGQDVLVLGATGNAGRMAIGVARRLGAGRIVAAGRDRQRLDGLTALGADEVVSLAGDAGEVAERLGGAAADVDVVLDYVWGEPAAAAIAAMITARSDRGRPLAWVQIGAVAGPTAPIPSAALRAARLQIVGSGQGSVATAQFVAELTQLADEIAGGAIAVSARAVPLADVTQAWASPAGGERIVIVP
jgi:NADPH:quinone reductase-like Zn-dependent oxidoreductase